MLRKSEGGRKPGPSGDLLLRPWVDLKGILLVADAVSNELNLVIFLGLP